MTKEGPGAGKVRKATVSKIPREFHLSLNGRPGADDTPKNILYHQRSLLDIILNRGS